MWQKLKLVAVNLLVFIGLLAALELYFRVIKPVPSAYSIANGVQLYLQPYVMFSSPPHAHYGAWVNSFTNSSFKADVTANNQGYNDKHEFSLSEPYHKAENERVVVFTGGSTAWGVGATTGDMTIAGRMEHYLNSAQSKLKYTVVNLGMGSWIAYQQFIGLEMWGAAFDPDWVISMDGHNDASVGCAYSQGSTNPLFFPVIKAYVDGYLGKASQNPVFYRGWLENELIKYSAAYRALTGKDYVPNSMKFDETNKDNTRGELRKVILPTKLGDAREMLAFYIKAEEAMLRLFPQARYILSTQPMVNQFDGDFTNVYASDDPAVHRAALEQRIREVDAHLTAHADETCSTETYLPSFVYLYVKGALELELLAERMRKQGRHVDYANTGQLFPNAREQRIPFFIDPAHLSDEGADVIGRYYADRILAAEQSDATGSAAVAR
jgi:hypothetical protein